MLRETITPPEEAQAQLLEESHLFGHFGAEAIVKDLHLKGMHWSNMKDQAVQLVKACPQCQKFNIMKKGFNPLRPMNNKWPGDHWCIDLAGKLPTTPRGNTFLLVMVDVCTRFCILRPIKDKKASTIVQQMIEVFCLMGIPRIVGSDGGTEFCNELMDLFMECAGINKRVITPYHPQANGTAERWVQGAIKGIKKELEGATQDWDIYTHSVQLGLNIKVSERHHSRPFSLMFARNLNEFRDYRNEKPEKALSIEEHKRVIREMEELVFPAIYDRTNKVNEDRKQKYDDKMNLVEYEPGTQVMVRVREKQGKFDAEYEGPYTVVRKTTGGSYVLRDLQNDLERRDYTPLELKPVVQTKESTERAYVVDRIVSHKLKNNRYQYKVRWKGYSPDHDTWEPPSSFNDPITISTYWRRIGQQEPASQRKQKRKDLPVSKLPRQSKRTKHQK